MCFTWDDVSQQFLQIGKTLRIDSMFKSSNRVLFFCSLAMSDLIDTDGRLRLSGKYLQSRVHSVKIMPGIVAKRKQQKNTNKASKTNKENQHNANTNKNKQEPNQTTLISAVSYHYVPRHHYMPPSVKLWGVGFHWVPRLFLKPFSPTSKNSCTEAMSKEKPLLGFLILPKKTWEVKRDETCEECCTWRTFLPT